MENTCARAAAWLLSLTWRWNEYVTKGYRVRIALGSGVFYKPMAIVTIIVRHRDCLLVNYPCRQRRLSTHTDGQQRVRRLAASGKTL